MVSHDFGSQHPFFVFLLLLLVALIPFSNSEKGISFLKFREGNFFSQIQRREFRLSNSEKGIWFLKFREGNSSHYLSEWSSGLRRVTRNHILETGRRFKSCFRRLLFFFFFFFFNSGKVQKWRRIGGVQGMRNGRN